MSANQAAFPIATMARVLGVSETGYHAWRHRSPSTHAFADAALNTPVERTRQIWDMYDAAATEAGFKGGPDYHGLLKQIHVAETEEKAIVNARQFMWMQGEFTGLAHPVWSTPAGYGSPENRRAFVEFATGRRRTRAIARQSRSRWKS